MKIRCILKYRACPSAANDILNTSMLPISLLSMKFSSKKRTTIRRRSKHRTETLDYAICLKGECDLELDDGRTVPMKAGDICVQRMNFAPPGANSTTRHTLPWPEPT